MERSGLLKQGSTSILNMSVNPSVNVSKRYGDTHHDDDDDLLESNLLDDDICLDFTKQDKEKRVSMDENG